MNLEKLLYKIENNQELISSFGHLDKKILKKINYKLRLEWNYNSNHIEGGTLTKGETRSVMIGNIDIHQKSIKDVIEMKGHDEVVLEVMKIGKGEVRISEKRIKDIHRSIIFEEDEVKKSQIGIWKTIENEIINYKNEKYNFPIPEEIPELIHKLLNKTNADINKIFYKKKNALHPVIIAANFHIDFVSIHPFFDGNGRIARVLTNLILITCGFPVIVIKSELLDLYHKLLGDIQCYGSDRVLFQCFVAERVLETQYLILDALKGKNIDEMSDWEKKLEMLKVDIASNEEVKITKNEEVVKEVFEQTIFPFIEKLLHKVEKFNDLFAERVIWFGNNHKLQSFESLIEIKERFNSDNKFYSDQTVLKLEWDGFKKAGINTFTVYIAFYWVFEEYKYHCHIDNPNEKQLEKLYHQKWENEEIEYLINLTGSKLMEFIEKALTLS